MKSKASIDGHPLHPILVAFPIAFFIGTFFFDIAAEIYNRPQLWQTGWYLNVAGIGCGLLAAIPGLIDYFFTVPPASSAKKRATVHGLLNSSVVIVFTAALIMKGRAVSPVPIIGLEGAGIVFLCIAGYMGGTLVYRNQIGVYNRYADKGKWHESHVSEVDHRIAVAAVGELKIDQMKLVHINNKRIVIAKTEQGYAAFDDRCTHKGGSLAGGVMICGTVQCPWHGSQFDVNTGIAKAGPATEKINTYRINETEGTLYLEL